MVHDDDGKPLYYESGNGQIAIKLNMLPGDQALVSGLSPWGTKAVSVYEYEGGTATILGCQGREETVRLLRNALDTLEALVPADADLHEPETHDPEIPS